MSFSNTTGKADTLIGAGAAVLHGSHVLLVKRAKPPRAGEWSLPGGRIEAGETPEQAAAREVLEETGVPVRILAHVETLEIPPSPDTGGRRIVLHDYLAEPLDPYTEVCAATDALEARWVPLDEVAVLVAWSETRRVIAKAAALYRLHDR